MSENKDAEGNKDNSITPEEMAMYEEYMSSHPDAEKVIPVEQRRDCEREVEELLTMLKAFESGRPIIELYSITNLSPDEAPNHPVREPARKALIPIVALLNTLKKETNISEEKYKKLEGLYKYLSNAVGMINASTGNIDHER